mmetsp:Transcript_12595/g.33923  ORF Transcript_12595/g.33923 Transcript_12595/m.33923 type:complete len:137 (+) Transcript_12595:32-442(+)
MNHFAEGAFWLAVVGAGAAAAKHGLSPDAIVLDLTPASADPANAARVVAPVRFWGGYAFAVMNAGFCAMGLWGAFTASKSTKQALLLGTAILFGAFAGVWLAHGAETAKKDYTRHAAKIAGLGILFFSAFLASVIS